MAGHGNAPLTPEGRLRLCPRIDADGRVRTSPPRPDPAPAGYLKHDSAPARPRPEEPWSARPARRATVCPPTRSNRSAGRPGGL